MAGDEFMKGGVGCGSIQTEVREARELNKWKECRPLRGGEPTVIQVKLLEWAGCYDLESRS